MHDEKKPEGTLLEGKALAFRLFLLQLYPADSLQVTYSVTAGYRYRFYGMEWQPWLQIEHCWYLVEQFELSVAYRPVWTIGKRIPWWWVGQQGITGVRVATFAELPMAICQAALKAHAWLTGQA